jgi:23S rRNA pseudouridine1911/1915/1917 synthase
VGAVSVNGVHAKKSLKLHSGDLVVIDTEKTTELVSKHSPLIPENLDLDIVYEDEDLWVINKPAGLVVHPASGHWQGTLVHALLARGALSNVAGTHRQGIVHRLDKGTSGLIVAAKNNKAHETLARYFARREVSKTYRAVVWGQLPKEESLIETFLGRHPVDRKKQAVVAEGRAAKTGLKSLNHSRFFSDLEVTLWTGRTHQIRVHCQYAKHPIVGDDLYGGRRNVPVLPPEMKKFLSNLHRPLLHAWKLEFTHPISNRLMSLEAKLPEDYRQALEILWKQ